MIVALSIACAVLGIVALLGWATASFRGAQIRQLRADRANRELTIASLEAQMVAGARDADALAAAGDLSRMLGASVPRGTFDAESNREKCPACQGAAPADCKVCGGDGEVGPLCTGCIRRVRSGSNPVQGCGDCWWLEGGS